MKNEIKINLKNAPKLPGIYLFKNKFEEVLYVGKAKNIYKRMLQYKNGSISSFKTFKLLQEIYDVNYFTTINETEALLLEKNLVDKYNPKYNILLRDDKRYPYIEIKLTTKIEVKIVYRILQRKLSWNRIILGPFPQGFKVKKMYNLISHILLFKKGILIKTLPHAEWERKFLQIKKIFSAGINQLLKELKLQMDNAAKNNQYEIALEIRDSIKSLTLLVEKQRIELLSNKNIDVFYFLELDEYLIISMAFYRQGILLSTKTKIVEVFINEEEIIYQFINQYYAKNLIPDFLISNKKIQTNIKTIKPSSGQLKRILELAQQNAKENAKEKIEKFLFQRKNNFLATEQLRKKINLKQLNTFIFIDNSFFNNGMGVSVVTFYKNGYFLFNKTRKFKHSNSEADNFLIYKALLKYFKNLSSPLDLIIVDGGINQINAAKKVAKNIKVIGLVKNQHHNTKYIKDWRGKKITIDNIVLYNFLAQIQEKTDFLAKKYLHFKSRKTLFGFLKSIKGIGEEREKKLLNHFGTYSNIYNASIKELSEIIPKSIALKIKEYLKNN